MTNHRAINWQKILTYDKTFALSMSSHKRYNILSASLVINFTPIISDLTEKY